MEIDLNPKLSVNTIPPETHGGAIDVPDKKDYRAEFLLGKDDTIPPDEILLYTKANSQGATQRCTAYSAYHVGRILNEIERQMKYPPNFLVARPDEGWKLQLEFGTGSEKNGDMVQTALKSIVKNGLICDGETFKIDGYAKIEKEDIRYWLAKGFPIVTSGRVTTTNFANAKKTGFWTGNDGKRVSGHAFALIGYEIGNIIALNSWGELWGFYKNGTFKIKDEIVKNLDTCYIVYDAKDLNMIFRDVSEKAPHAEAIKWALDKGLMKGYDSENIDDPKKRFFMPEKAVTRSELAETLYRYSQFIN